MSNNEYGKFFEQMSQSYTSAFNPFASLQELNTKTAEQLTHQQLGAASALVQNSTKSFNKISTAKRVDEVISISNSLISETAAQSLEMIQQVFDQALSTNAEYGKWFETNLLANFKKASEEVVTKSKGK